MGISDTFDYYKGGGVAQLDSSSGSSSDSDSSDGSSDSSDSWLKGSIIRDYSSYVELVPEGEVFVLAREEWHCSYLQGKAGKTVSARKLDVSSNKYRTLPRRLEIKHPKCIRCFPKNNNRIRSLSQLTASLDDACKRAKGSTS